MVYLNVVTAYGDSNKEVRKDEMSCKATLARMLGTYMAVVLGQFFPRGYTFVHISFAVLLLRSQSKLHASLKATSCSDFGQTVEYQYFNNI